MSRHLYAGAAAHLGVAQLAVVLDALGDAAEYRASRGGQYCAACEAEYGGLCWDHAADEDRADRYGMLARQLREEAAT